MLQGGADFVDSMVAMKPYWFTRTLAGMTMDIGAFSGMWNLYRTAMEGTPISRRAGRRRVGAGAALDIAPMKRIEPIILIAALGFYALAMTSQGSFCVVGKEDDAAGNGPHDSRGTIVASPRAHAVGRERPEDLHPRGLLVLPFAIHPPGESRHGQMGPGFAGGGNGVTTCHRCSGPVESGPSSRAKGNRRSDEWHYAHHWNPRAVEPESIMPSFDMALPERSRTRSAGARDFIREVRREPRRPCNEERARQERRRQRDAGRAPAGLETAGRLAGERRRHGRGRSRRYARLRPVSPQRRWSASRRIFRRSERRSETGESGSRGRPSERPAPTEPLALRLSRGKVDLREEVLRAATASSETGGSDRGRKDAHRTSTTRTTS